MARTEKTDADYEEEWRQVRIAKDKVRQATALLHEVEAATQADGRPVIRLRMLAGVLETLDTQVALFDKPLYQRCFGCGWMSMHIAYRIKGDRSRCCNE